MSEDNPTIDPAEQTAEVVPAPRTDMSVPEMREWLRNWVANATGQAPDAVDESVPMVELGLSSRDAVAMASDIEDLTGVTLTATVASRLPVSLSRTPWFSLIGPLRMRSGFASPAARSFCRRPSRRLPWPRRRLPTRPVPPMPVLTT